MAIDPILNKLVKDEFGESAQAQTQLQIEDWGLVDYLSACEKQLSILEKVAVGEKERVIFCQHPPLVTLGRGSKDHEVNGWSGAVFQSSRGGKATYHGPSQLVIYPILNLKKAHANFPTRDIHGYLRWLEQYIIKTLSRLGLPDCEARTTQVDGLSLTGVWTGEKKIASIGIAVRKWVTYHGAAVNILNDPEAFKGLNPCGFSANTMTSLEQQLGRSVDFTAVKSEFHNVLLTSYRW